MQMLIHVPDDIAIRFKQIVPARQRSAYVSKLLKNALPLSEEDDPLYHIALAVEQDAALNAEMREWRQAVIADGIRGIEYGEESDATR